GLAAAIARSAREPAADRCCCRAGSCAGVPRVPSDSSAVRAGRFDRPCLIHSSREQKATARARIKTFDGGARVRTKIKHVSATPPVELVRQYGVIRALACGAL